MRQPARQWNIRLFSDKSSPHGLAGNVQHMSHAITDLQPAMDYEAMVAVENKFGWSEESEVFHFYTRKGEGRDEIGDEIG